MGAADPFNELPDQDNGETVFLAYACMSTETRGVDSFGFIQRVW